MLSPRLLVNSRLLVVHFGGSQELYVGSQLPGGGALTLGCLKSTVGVSETQRPAAAVPTRPALEFLCTLCSSPGATVHRADVSSTSLDPRIHRSTALGLWKLHKKLTLPCQKKKKKWLTYSKKNEKIPDLQKSHFSQLVLFHGFYFTTGELGINSYFVMIMSFLPGYFI